VNLFSPLDILVDMLVWYRHFPDANSIRTDGSYVYEELLPSPKDIKVYTVGTTYAYAETRKSPTVDGVVERDAAGKELRLVVRLTDEEQEIARRICTAFRQTVCGFDLLRSNGRSYVIDVNGWSFVKGSLQLRLRFVSFSVILKLCLRTHLHSHFFLLYQSAFIAIAHFSFSLHPPVCVCLCSQILRLVRLHHSLHVPHLGRRAAPVCAQRGAGARAAVALVVGDHDDCEPAEQ
jgi:hypothetical protein